MEFWNSEFDRFVAHSTKNQEGFGFENEPVNGVKYIDFEIGRKVGFNRVAVRYNIVPAGCRSSYPHAESLEEEFVFVLKGNPHLWLNGYIYDLHEGHAVGFSSGTGVAHTFINNTNEEVHLLVAGEQSKSDNLCSFPINPELKDSCEIWWDNPPFHKLGPHNGCPGCIKDHERGTDEPGCVVYCPEIKKSFGFHYPGDNETFGNGFRLSDKVGLKTLGIWYDYLSAGRRSAFPHAHTHEEEFVYVIKGSPTVWVDGYTKNIEPEWFAAFPSNTGFAHTLINNSSDEIVYLCIGEAKDFVGEKIIYPLNSLRNKECERKGWLWKELLDKKIGPHSGVSNKSFSDHFALRLCSESDADEVFGIFKTSERYFLKVDGCLPNREIARKSIVNSPKETNSKYFKEFLIVEQDDVPIGVVDLHANYPEEKICYLGLLLIGESLFGKGVGRACYQLIEDYIKCALNCSKVRLGISEENEVTGFWEKMGFTPNGRIYDYQGEAKTTRVHEFDKMIKEFSE